MTFPFQEINPSEKLFSCFVCGFCFRKYDEFRQHIINEHEEGREYLICPLTHCQSPIRDLRTHWRAKHTGITMPQSAQMKATVFYDTRQQGKKKKIPSFKEGFFESVKNNKKLHYRSSYEEKVYKCLETMGNVIRYDVETFKIPYFFKGKKKTYWPDISVYYADGAVEIWEIKPASQTALEQNKAKWDAAKYFCSLRGWNFKVLNEQMIQKLIIETQR